MTRRMHGRYLSLAVFLVGLGLGRHARGDVMYTVTDLGAVPPSTTPYPNGVPPTPYRDDLAPHFNSAGDITYGPVDPYTSAPLFHGPDPTHQAVAMFASVTAGTYTAGMVEWRLSDHSHDGDGLFISDGVTTSGETGLSCGVSPVRF